MKQVLGSKLSYMAKYWLDASEGNKFLWVWFIPLREVVIVLEEEWKRGSSTSYTVKWWDIKGLEELLSEYWVGAYRYKGYKLNKMDAIERNCAEEELEEAREWWKIRKKYVRAEELDDKERSLYIKGIRKGYYLLPCF